MSTYPNIIAVKDARIAELEAENERLKNLVGDPEGTAAHAEAFLARAERAEAQLAEARKALEPFADIAGEPWADESGWTDAACQNDRICDWFGPSAFLAAHRALTGGQF